MKPPPPMPELSGSTTLRANCTATAASTAFPPCSKTLAPTSAARGFETATTPPLNPFCSALGGTPDVGCGRSAPLTVDSATNASAAAPWLRIHRKSVFISSLLCIPASEGGALPIRAQQTGQHHVEHRSWHPLPPRTTCLFLSL